MSRPSSCGGSCGQQATLQTLGDVDARGAVREERRPLRRPSRADAATPVSPSAASSRRSRSPKASSRSPTARKPSAGPPASPRSGTQAKRSIPGTPVKTGALVWRRPGLRRPARGFPVRQTTPGAPSPAAQRPGAGRPAGADLVPGVAGRRRAVEAACHSAARAGGAAGRFDGGAQHVGFAARARPERSRRRAARGGSAARAGDLATVVAGRRHPSVPLGPRSNSRAAWAPSASSATPRATSRRTPTTPTTKTSAAAHSRAPGATRTKKRRRKPSQARRRRMPEPRASSSR